MASFGLTIEDGSPLITYAPSGAWNDTPGNDPSTSSYSGQSFHTTSSRDATATIQFHGTSLTIFGGHRPDYGTFSVSIDGKSLGTASAAGQQFSAKQVLAQVTGLSNGPHTAVLSNVGGAPIDIDYADISVPVDVDPSDLTTTVIDDNDSRFVYAPSSSDWSTNSGSSFMNGTLHFSSSPNAQASVSFVGDAIALYGTVSPDHADMEVSIDGGSPQKCPGGSSGHVSALRTQILLYYANGLGAGDHTLRIASVQGQGTGPFIDIDAAVVYSAPSFSAGSSGDSQGNTTPSAGRTQPTAISSAAADQSGSSSSVPIGPIVGGVIGGVVMILGLVGLIFFLKRKRDNRRRMNKSDISGPVSPDGHLPMQQPDMAEAGVGFQVVSPGGTYGGPAPGITRLEPVRPKKSWRQSAHSIAPSYYSRESLFPTASSTHSRVSSNASSSSPMLPGDVPVLKLPRAPGGNRYRNGDGSPARPSRRPTLLDLSE